ncbi:O-antigen ligase family protein [Castellaniella sp. UC4442_H9]
MLLLLLVTGMALTYSRGAIVSFVVACGSWLICKRNKHLFVSYFTSILLLAAVLMAVNPDLFAMRAFHGSSGRMDMWTYALRFVFENGNYIGVGVGRLAGVMHAGGFLHSSTHNFFLDSMIEYGVTYVLLLLTLLGYALWVGFHKNVRQFPVLVFLFVSSNFIVISVGGIGLLSFMYTAAVLVCALNLPACQLVQ